MHAMRMVLAQEGLGSCLSRMSDETVIHLVAGLVGSGRLHVHSQPWRAEIAGGGTQISDVAGASAAAPAFPLSDRKSSGPSASSGPAANEGDPTLPDDTDYSAQAAALTAAASEGQPFCPQ
jgi:hypothetical protein